MKLRPLPGHASVSSELLPGLLLMYWQFVRFFRCFQENLIMCPQECFIRWLQESHRCQHLFQSQAPTLLASSSLGFSKALFLPAETSK